MSPPGDSAKGGKMILQANATPRKVGVAVLTSDSTEFKIKKGNKRQRQTFYNDKGDNSLRKHNT